MPTKTQNSRCCQFANLKGASAVSDEECRIPSSVGNDDKRTGPDVEGKGASDRTVGLGSNEQEILEQDNANPDQVMQDDGEEAASAKAPTIPPAVSAQVRRQHQGVRACTWKGFCPCQY